MADKALSPEIMKLMDKIANNPTSRLFVPLAEEYLKAEMLDEAIFVLVDGIKNHPTYVAARVMLGKIYLQKKQIAEAKNEFEQVIAVNPENILASKKLASIYQAEGEIQKAFDACKRILMIDPSDKETKQLLASLEKERAVPPLPNPVKAPEEVPGGVGAEAVLPPGKEVFQGGYESPPPSESSVGEQQAPESPPSFLNSSPEPEASAPPFESAENLQVEGSSPSASFSNQGSSEQAPAEGQNAYNGQADLDEIKIFDGPLPGMEEIKVEGAQSGDVGRQPEIDPGEKPILSDFSEPFAMGQPSSDFAEALPESESREELATPTLASLYLDQGHFKEAVEVYRKILARDPSNRESLKGLEYALQKLNGPPVPHAGSSGSENNRSGQPQGKTQRLQSWLDSIRKGKQE